MAINVATPEIKAEILKWKKKDMTVSFIIKMFGTTANKINGKMEISPPKFDTKMVLHLKAKEYINTEDITTTIGSFLFNKLMIEDRLESIIPGGFFDGEINKKRFDVLLNIIGEALKSNKIKISPTLVGFLADYENYGLKLPSIFSPSYSLPILKPNKETMKMREDDMANNIPETVQDMAKLEAKWVKDAVGHMEDDPSMALYRSGARGSFDNNYKNMSIAIGAVENPSTGQYDFITSNLIDGIQKKDLVAAGNIVVTSEYPKAVGTQVGGYLTKQFYAIFQSVVLDKPNTDCGSKGYWEIILLPEFVDSLKYQYILDNGKLVMLSDENSSKYVNTKIKLRSPMYCLSDKICSKCAGERPYIIDIENIGLTAGRISNNLLNQSMKKRHDITVKMNSVDINKLIM